MVRHAPIHRRSGHSDIAICCGRNVRGSSPSTSVVPLSNQVTTLNHKRFKGFKMFSDGHLDSQYVGYVALSQVIETVASRLGVVPIVARIHDSADIKDAIQSFAQEPNGGLVVLPSPVTAVERELIVGLAAKHRLPAVYPYKFFTVSGGLVAYGVDPPDFYRRAASY